MPKDIIWWRSKIGFNSRTVDWRQDGLRNWFNDTVYEQHFINSDLGDNFMQLQSDIFATVNKNSNYFSRAILYYYEHKND